MTTLRRIALCTAPLWLAACAVTAPPPTAPAPVPTQWHAPLPHAGTLGDLSQWWTQLDDPVLLQLMDAAQQASPGIASARSRIEQARATRTTAGAALLPAVDGAASTQRGFTESVGGIATTTQGALQAAWPAARTWVPAPSLAHVQAWDEDALTFGDTAQRCARFVAQL